MIADQPILSGRTTKHRGLARRQVRKFLTASLASAVMTLTSFAAWGTEVQNSKPQRSRFEAIALPPIPSQDSIPWLDWKIGVKVDTLLSPVLDPSGIKLEPAKRNEENSAVS